MKRKLSVLLFAGAAVSAGLMFSRAHKACRQSRGQGPFPASPSAIDENGLGKGAFFKGGFKLRNKTGRSDKIGKLSGYHNLWKLSTSSTKTVAPPTVISRGMAIVLTVP